MEQTVVEEKSSLKWLILLTVIIGTFLGSLDKMIVNLALPKIISDFHITVSAAGWISTAYILANAVFVPIWGKLGDTWGRKKVYVIGFTVFIFGSILAGLSWNIGSMLLFRVIQAVASSADYPTAMAIIAVTFKEGKERGQALGIWSSAFAASTVFGPLIGGPLIDNFGWRSVFLVNLPVGLIGLFMALTFINESVSEKKTMRFDWWGSLMLGGMLSALVLVLDKGIDWGWMSTESVISYAVIVFCALAFYFIEKHHPEPIVDLKFFSNSIFVNTLINNAVIFMAMMGAIFLVPIFAQTFLGYDATQTGYLFMPMAAGLLIAAPLGARLMGKVEARYVIAISTAVAGAGIYMLSWLDPRSGPWVIAIPMFLFTFGMGFGMSQRTNSIAVAVPKSEIGVASSVLALVRNISGAFGIAIFSTMLTNLLKNNVLTVSRMSDLYVHTPQAIGEFTALITLKAQILAYTTIFATAATIMFIGAFLALFIKVDKKEELEEVFIMES